MTRMTTMITTGGCLIMNDKIKESGVATGLRITFAILMVFTVGIFTNCIVLHNTVLNKTFWKKTIKSDEIQEVMKEQLTDMVREYVISYTPTVPGGDGENVNMSLEELYNLETGDEFTDEMIDYTLDEIMDMFLEGDTTLDEERFDELFDQYEERYADQLEESGVSMEEIRQSKEQLFNQLNQSMKEMEKANEETEILEIINMDEYKKQNNITMIVTGVLNVIMIVVLIILHKNKFKPVRATGIAVTVTEVMSLIGWAIVFGVFKATGSAVTEGGELFEMLIKAALNSIKQVMGIFGIAAGIGVALIILGCVGAGIVTSSLKKKAAGNAVQYAPAAATATATAAAVPAAAPAPVQQVPVQQAPVQQVSVQPAPVPVAPAPVAPAPVQQPSSAPDGWTCPNCGKTGITGNFCNNCGTKKEVAAVPQAEEPAVPSTWDCPNCGATGIETNFCNNCGTKRP